MKFRCQDKIKKQINELNKYTLKNIKKENEIINRKIDCIDKNIIKTSIKTESVHQDINQLNNEYDIFNDNLNMVECEINNNHVINNNPKILKITNINDSYNGIFSCFQRLEIISEEIIEFQNLLTLNVTELYIHIITKSFYNINANINLTSNLNSISYTNIEILRLNSYNYHFSKIKCFPYKLQVIILENMIIDSSIYILPPSIKEITMIDCNLANNNALLSLNLIGLNKIKFINTDINCSIDDLSGSVKEITIFNSKINVPINVLPLNLSYLYIYTKYELKICNLPEHISELKLITKQPVLDGQTLVNHTNLKKIVYNHWNKRLLNKLPEFINMIVVKNLDINDFSDYLHNYNITYVCFDSTNCPKKIYGYSIVKNELIDDDVTNDIVVYKNKIKIEI